MMSLRIIFALAVISLVTGDNNVTTTPQTDAADGPAHPDRVLESAETTLLSGEVRTSLVSCYFAGWGTQIEPDKFRKKKSDSEIWIHVFAAIIISDLYIIQNLRLK